MGDDKKLISLKDAAQISGYSSDYIGQLIRAGKIPGKQVYVNVAWMTTAEAVLNYKHSEGKKKNSIISNYIGVKYQKLSVSLEIFRLIFQNFKSALPVFTVLSISFLFLIVYFLYNTIHLDTNYKNKNQNMASQLNY